MAWHPVCAVIVGQNGAVYLVGGECYLACRVGRPEGAVRHIALVGLVKVGEYQHSNAWLVDSLVWVDGADAEMAALDASTLDFARSAVADRTAEEA